MPIWSQIYLAWLVIFGIGLVWISQINLVKSPVEINKFYDYKKEYNNISSNHLRNLNVYPNAHEYNRTLLNQVNNEINRYRWRIEEFSSTHQKVNCKFTRYYIDKEKTNLVILFDHNGITNIFYFMHTFAAAVINENLHNISLISIQGHPICTGYALKKFEKDSTQITRYLQVSTGTNKKPELQIVNATGKFSTILWSAILPDSLSRPSLVNQLIQAALPLFQKGTFGENSTAMQGIGWLFTNDIYKNEVNAIHTILPPLMYTVKNYQQISTKEIGNTLWLGKEKALSSRGAILLSCLLILLIWLPVANRLYQNESINHLIRSFFSAFYSSLVFFVLAVYIKIGSHAIPVGIYGTLFIPIIFILIHFFLNKAKKSIFDFNANFLTEFIVLNVFSSVLIFYNFALFIFLLPVIFAVNRKSESGFSAFKILLFLSMLPLMYASYVVGTSVSFEDVTNLVSLVWIAKCVFSSLTASVIFFLCGGSILSIARESR